MATIEYRKNGDGKTNYRVRIRLTGERPRTRTFSRLTDAKVRAATVEADLGRDVHVPTAPERRRTLGQLIGLPPVPWTPP